MSADRKALMAATRRLLELRRAQEFRALDQVEEADLQRLSGDFAEMRALPALDAVAALLADGIVIRRLRTPEDAR